MLPVGFCNQPFAADWVSGQTVYTRENTLVVVLAGAAGNGACVIFYLSVPTPT